MVSRNGPHFSWCWWTPLPCEGLCTLPLRLPDPEAVDGSVPNVHCQTPGQTDGMAGYSTASATPCAARFIGESQEQVGKGLGLLNVGLPTPHKAVEIHPMSFLQESSNRSTHLSMQQASVPSFGLNVQYQGFPGPLGSSDLHQEDLLLSLKVFGSLI